MVANNKINCPTALYSMLCYNRQSKQDQVLKASLLYKGNPRQVRNVNVSRGRSVYRMGDTLRRQSVYIITRRGFSSTLGSLLCTGTFLYAQCIKQLIPC